MSGTSASGHDSKKEINYAGYLFNTLQPNQLEEWFDHLADVFGPKGTPRNYFVNHWKNDPNSRFDSIFVALFEGKIVSTVRVFIRKIYLGNQIFRMGGIGEVSTKSAHRGKQLATKLLNMATDFMKSESIDFGSLHTGNAVPLYESVGFVSVTRSFITYPISEFKERDDFGKEWTIEQCDIQSHLQTLKKLHSDFNVKFDGPVVRDDDEYWLKWISHEAQSNFHILKHAGKVVGAIGVDVNSKKTDELLLKDFFIDIHSAQYQKDQGFGVFVHLINELRKLNPKLAIANAIMIPAPLFQNVGFSKFELNSEKGLMYFLVSKDQNKASDWWNLDFKTGKSNEKHLFWKFDGY